MLLKHDRGGVCPHDTDVTAEGQLTVAGWPFASGLTDWQGGSLTVWAKSWLRRLRGMLRGNSRENGSKIFQSSING